MTLRQKFLLISKEKKKFKHLLFSKRTSGGRNWSGKITVRGRGSKSKKKFKIIDVYRAVWNIPFFLKRLEYDPNRLTLISLFSYSNGIISYMISIEGLVVGDKFMNGVRIKKKSGNSLPIKNIGTGIKISNLEITLFGGSVFLRSAGSFGKVLRKSNKFCIVKLKSGKLKRVNYFCMVTIGVVMNFNYYLNRYKNAGWNRLRGFKSHVRGVAMNPVDHPHGGGEGKKSKKVISMSPWGRLIKGKKTKKTK